MHRGLNETIRRVKDRYNWAGMNKDIENFIKKCNVCQKVKISSKILTLIWF